MTSVRGVDGRPAPADLAHRVGDLERSGGHQGLIAGDLVAVRHDEPDLFTFLADSLWPFFRVVDGPGDAPFTLRVIRDPLDGVAVPEHWPVRYAAAYLDGDPLLAVRYSAESARSQYNWYTPTDLVVDRGAELLLISSRDNVGVTVRRVLRNHILYPYIQAAGHLPLHAAAIVAPDRDAVIMPGPSGTGKTSTSLPLVLEDGWSLLATDLVFVGPLAAPAARGTPENITLGVGTIANSPRLAELMPASFRGAEPGDPRLWGVSEKVALRLKEFSRRLDVPVVDRAGLRMFAFPVVAPDIARASVRPLDPAEVERRLLVNLMSPEYRGYTAMLRAFRVDPCEVVSTATALARALAATVPGFQVAHDGSHEQQEQLRALINGVW